MSVSNGQIANASTFNSAFVSRTIDTDLVGRIDLKNVVIESGVSIINVQKNINALYSLIGIAPNQLKDASIVWSDSTTASLISKVNELLGSIQIKYPLINNQITTNVVGFVLNNTTEKSAQFTFEIERVGTAEFRQIIQAQAVWSGAAWSLIFGGYAGSDIISDTLLSTENIVLTIDAASGQLQYSSGNLAGHTLSNLKVSQTRMKV